ncbi:LLM class flavin-dependent oxidoreductase [Streptomyces sp. AJS327]|uniref:MupA/Atu3671 family FMN-dependent luciferase-like monooxygenase n=1 Tax=Streptomyces sp. AJS327 TaxID=2545265 RepID=UPI0015DFB6E4|nr:MupA/Atu3671 family FMN-dependent luciferase-like monooxygenase [Streptomyces sp. AJS327]MBA0052411.1 LLM class flavin-dependent oxidoreductase [Streptomyces sp. AJS327]
MDFSAYFFSADDRTDAGERYRFVIDVARYVDQHGFRAVWTPERHFQEFGGSFPNPSVLSAALAAVTTSVDLRAGSVVVPHHHAVRIAEEWALVDQISGGRVGLCLATGWHRGDFVFYPERYENRREHTFEQIDTLRALWRGEPVTFPGPGGQDLEIRTFPRPHSTHLPLWLVHSSNPQTWRQAGRAGTNVLTLLDNWDRLRDNIATYREARDEAGHDPAAGTVTVAVHTYVGDDDTRVRELVEEPVTRYLGTFLTQRRGDASLSGESKTMTEEEHRSLSRYAFEDMYGNRSLLGTEEKCAATVERLAAIGTDEIACMIDFGLPLPTVLDGLPALNRLRARFAPTPAVTDYYRHPARRAR